MNKESMSHDVEQLTKRNQEVVAGRLRFLQSGILALRGIGILCSTFRDLARHY